MRHEKKIDPDAPFASFAQALRDLRNDAGLNSASLAKRAHLSPATVSRALTGRELPTVGTTRAIANACGANRNDWVLRREEAEREHLRRATGPRDTSAPTLMEIKEWRELQEARFQPTGPPSATVPDEVDAPDHSTPAPPDPAVPIAPVYNEAAPVSNEAGRTDASDPGTTEVTVRAEERAGTTQQVSSAANVWKPTGHRQRPSPVRRSTGSAPRAPRDDRSPASRSITERPAFDVGRADDPSTGRILFIFGTVMAAFLLIGAHWVGDAEPYDPLTVVAGDPPILVEYGVDRLCGKTSCVDVDDVTAVKWTLDVRQPIVRTTFTQGEAASPNGIDVFDGVEGRLRITEVQGCGGSGAVRWTVRAGDTVVGRGEVTSGAMVDTLSPQPLPPGSTNVTFDLVSNDPACVVNISWENPWLNRDGPLPTS